ncbi:DCP1 domain containing protein [Trichuris trichiura]|uniref:DCP1 domain containing protein n=1 Tax=Trichuris trichiura TaxID=36087 RepID=A0A077YVD3_TRITR|nr:DCP1 domain containing protein [Trichuris trichiura]
MSRMDMNLATLRKFDSSVVRVIHSAGHVALYKFDNDLSGWKKTDVEGSLFICLCEGSSMYKMFVLNRLSPENFVLQIDLNFDCVEKDEFLLYRNWESIGAIWFFKEHERSKVIKCLNTLAKMVSSQNIEDEVPSVSSSSNGNAIEAESNITTLLDNAFQKFLMEKSASRKHVAKSSGSPMTSEALNSLAELAMDSRPKEPLHPLLQNMFVSHGSFPGSPSGASENDAVNNLFQEKATFNETKVATANVRAKNRFPFNQLYISDSYSISQEERLKKSPTRSHNIEVECFRRALLGLVKEDDDFCEKLYLRYKQAMDSKASGKQS